MDIYKEGYDISSKICDIYIGIITDFLTNNCDVSKYQDRLRMLRNLISLEDSIYDKLSIEMVNYYIDCTYLDDFKGDKFLIDRYYRNLEDRKLKLYDHFMVDDNISFNSFFDGTLIMYVLSRMYYNIDDCLNDQYYFEDNFTNNLMDYFIAQMFFYLTITKYSEKMALKYNFDIRRLYYFERDKFYNIVSNVYKNVDELIIPFAKRDIDSIFSFYKMKNDLIKVFSNLYNFYDLEVLLKLLDNDSINELNEYYNLKLNGIDLSNSPEISNIKRLIKTRNEEL